MKNFRGYRWAFSLALISLLGAGFQSSADLFQKGLRLERSEGDLRKAIAVYSQIVEKNDDETLAAQAQFRIGVCLEKLGKAEAISAFQKILDRFPRQTEIVREARERIYSLSGSETLRPEFRSDLGLRRVWSDPDINMSTRVSPDGKYLAFRQTRTGNLAIRDLFSGKIFLVKENSKEKPGAKTAMSISWAPDGARLAYLWGDFRMPRQTPLPELYIYDVAANTSELFLPKANLMLESLRNWTSDQKKILARVADGRGRGFIGFISLADKTFKPIYDKVLSIYEFMTSPDGKLVVSAFSKDGGRENSLSFLSTDSGVFGDTILRAPEIRLIGWSREGDRFLFFSDKLGHMDLWTVSLKDGKPVDEPEMIRRDMGNVYSLGLTIKDEIAFAKTTILNEIHSLDYDFVTGQLKEPGKRISRPSENCDMSFVLSPDGRLLAYLTKEGQADIHGRRDIDYLCLYSFEDGQYREYPVNERVEIASLTWLNNETVRLVLGNGGVRAQKDLNVVNGKWGSQHPYEPESYDNWEKGVLSPNGRYIYKLIYSAEREGPKSTLIQVDQTTKEEKVISSFIGPGSLRVYFSPDKRFLALAKGEKPGGRGATPGKISVVSLDEGIPKVAFVDPDPERSFLNLAWRPDSRGFVLSQLLFRKNAETDRVLTSLGFWVIPIDGSSAKKIEYDSPRSSGFSMHATDGGRMVFQIHGRPDGELWILENALRRDQ